MATFKIVEDNTAPNYTITCTRDTSAIDLTSASSVTLIIKNKASGTITQTGKAATISSPSTGVITYTAAASDFPSAGLYVGDIKVDWGSSGIEILYNQVSWKVRSKIQ